MTDAASWNTRSVRDIADIYDGPHATPHKTERGPWFLSISSLQQGRLVLSESAHLSEEDFAKWTRRVTPQPDDVLFSYETRLGEAALMPDGVSACLGRRMAILRPRPAEVSPRFLLYAYLGPEFQQEIDRRAVRGATVDRIPLNELGEWPIRLPDRSTQDAIADVLGTLDDKIEANQRTVQLEEELATRLLEQAPNRIRLGDVATVQRTIIDPAASGTTMVDHFSLPAFDERHLPVRQSGAEIKSGKQRIDDVSVLVSRLNPHIPRVWYAVPEPGVLGVASTEFVVMTSLGAVTAEELWACCNSTSFTSSLGESVTGTTGSHQRVQATDVLAIEVGDPSSIPDVHRLALNAMVKSACLLRKESVGLTIVRDALLPKLLSGELRVRDAESLVEENDARILVDNTR